MTTQESPMNSCRVVPSEEVSIRFVDDLARRADMHRRTTYSPAEAIELLRASGYAVDANVLADYIRWGYFNAPKRDWTAVNVHQLAAALETRRRWFVTPNELHDCKKSRARMEAETNPEMIVAEAKKYTSADLIRMMCNADHREIRESLLVVIEARLHLLGVNDG